MRSKNITNQEKLKFYVDLRALHRQHEILVDALQQATPSGLIKHNGLESLNGTPNGLRQLRKVILPDSCGTKWGCNDALSCTIRKFAVCGLDSPSLPIHTELIDQLQCICTS